MRYIASLGGINCPPDIGEKARSLHWLMRRHYVVPRTWVIPFDVFRAYRSHPERVLPDLRAALAKVLKPDRVYAVRSSASLEDQARYSYAGQFKTVLNVRGMDALLSAVEEVWQTAFSGSVQAYSDRTHQDVNHLQMAVILQEMVEPSIAGVAFSKNPLTGFDEVIVEAVCGSGEQLVQAGKTPARWVHKWGKWLHLPDDNGIPLPVIEQVVAETRRIAAQRRIAVDLEWVYDGQRLVWVQLRPITNLDRINIYSNRISREVFPGLIKPLIWSISVPLVNGAWIRLFTEMIGPNNLRPEDLARSFAYRCYFNMGAIGRIFEMLGLPKASLELMLGVKIEEGSRPRMHFSWKTLGYFPRLAAFVLRKANLDPFIHRELAALRENYAVLRASSLRTMDEAILVRQIERFYEVNQRAAFLNIQVPLLTNIYTRLLMSQFKQAGVDFHRFNLTYRLPDLYQDNPQVAIQNLARAYRALPPDTRADVAAWTDLPEKVGTAALGFHAQLLEFLDRFGHLSDSGSDFSSMPWRETPGLLLQMVRQNAARLENAEPAEGDTRLTWDSLPVGRLRRLWLGPFYRRARRYSVFREQVSFLYVYGYSQFRVYFQGLGRRLAGRGLLHQADDIYYLTWEEVKTLVKDGVLPGEKLPAALATSRCVDLEASRAQVLPDTIFGDELLPAAASERLGTTTAGAETNQILSGIPVSGGYYQGPARVIYGLADFERLRPGDVLIIPYSDVSWTPLFNLAGAIVSESGGLLSHSAIVARDYHLPCVVSVSQCCSIPDGTLLMVDGYSGQVRVLDQA